MLDLPDIRRKWQPIGHLWPILAAACFGLIVVGAWFAVSIWEERLARSTFNSVAQDYADALKNGIKEYLGKILAVRAFYDASVEVEPEEFARFTERDPRRSAAKNAHPLVPPCFAVRTCRIRAKTETTGPHGI
jgi:CHASE1-domain containing sensor protein